MKKTLTLILFSIIATISYAQVGIGLENPNDNSNIHIDSNNGTRGIMLPHITDEQQTALEGKLTLTDDGISFYNVDTKCVVTWKGEEFSQLCEQGKAKFSFSCDDSEIFGTYRQGYTVGSAEYIRLVLDVTQDGPYDISGSSNNGFYFSSSGYLTTGLQNIIIPAYGNPSKIESSTIKLKDNLNSADLCSFTVNVLSGSGSASITPEQCSSIKTTNMVKNNDIEISFNISIEVTLPGPIDVETNEVNGVTFRGTGNYATTGTHTLTLESNGIPEEDGVFSYSISGLEGDPCSFDVTVLPDVTAPISVGSLTSEGVYLERIKASNSNKIVANNIDFGTNTGAYTLGIRYVSGEGGDPQIKFQNASGTVTSSGTILNTVTFPVVDGTIPTSKGNYTYEIYDIYTGQVIGSSGNTVEIYVKPLIGSFDSPATSCQDIFNEYNTSDNLVLNDGEYWIGVPGSQYKTLCDMVSSSEATEQGKTVGGYTLIWSYSEYTNMNRYTRRNVGSMTQYGKDLDWNRNNPALSANLITTNTDLSPDLNNYRITSAEAKRLGVRVTRVTYKNNPKNFDTDELSKDFYMESVSPVGWIVNGGNNNSAVFGKYLGFNLSIETTSNGECGKRLTLGTETSGSFCYYANDGYGYHWNVNWNFQQGQVRINNLWGYYGERDHDKSPFGKCLSPQSYTDGGISYQGCDENRTVHPGVNGQEGTVQQWWVK